MREAVKIAHKKTHLAAAVVARGRYAVRRVAQVLGVSRSQLSQRLKEPGKSRSICRKPENDDLLVELRALVDERPTYGHRRIIALLNRARRKVGFAHVNHKRIYRLISRHGLLLQRYTGRPPDRAHDGIIRTIRSNARWASDDFQIPCSDQAVHVAFSLDTCDREIISWCAGTGAISGEMIRDLMLQSVEQRFRSTATTHPLRWLSSNGSCYRAHETIEFAPRLGLVPCFTPPRSPQSNGMAEAFVKTFMRDYVRVSECRAAESVLSQTGAWFEDYNDNHPHRGLRMKSPREFIRSYHQTAACPA